MALAHHGHRPDGLGPNRFRPGGFGPDGLPVDGFGPDGFIIHCFEHDWVLGPVGLEPMDWQQIYLDAVHWGLVDL